MFLRIPNSLFLESFLGGVRTPILTPKRPRIWWKAEGPSLLQRGHGAVGFLRVPFLGWFQGRKEHRSHFGRPKSRNTQEVKQVSFSHVITSFMSAQLVEVFPMPVLVSEPLPPRHLCPWCLKYCSLRPSSCTGPLRLVESLPQNSVRTP